LIEKNLKTQVAEKDHEIETVKLEYRKKLNDEKKKTEHAQEFSKKYKEDGDKKYALVVQEVLFL